MLKCGKTLKIALLLAGIYIAFMAVLLTEISNAKYAETRVAYTNFGAASFNTVIVNDTEGGYAAFTVFDEPVQAAQVSGYRPGMKYDADQAKNTAQEIPFTVANGMDRASASDAAVEYVICLRTTGHLPLKYTLRCKQSGSSFLDYAAQFEGTLDDNGTTWYEYRFYQTVGEEKQEVTFELDGGDLHGNDYTLVVEWPVPAGEDTNDVKYIKEVDLLELFVTVSSKNMLEVEGYGKNPNIQIQPGTGILILDTQRADRFVHTLDYRAFTTKNSTTTYNFIIENGVGKQVQHKKVNTDYTIEIEVPYTNDTKSFGYSLKGETGDVPWVESGYRVYDVLYYGKGSTPYKTYESEPPAADVTAYSAPDSPYKLYKVYKVPAFYLENLKHDEHQYQLVLTGPDSAKIESVAFANKIDIIVTAQESGTAITGGPSAEGGDGDA